MWVTWQVLLGKDAQSQVRRGFALAALHGAFSTQGSVAVKFQLFKSQYFAIAFEASTGNQWEENHFTEAISQTHEVRVEKTDLKVETFCRVGSPLPSNKLEQAKREKGAEGKKSHRSTLTAVPECDMDG